MENKTFRLNGHLIFGLLLIVAGILFALNNFDLIEPRLVRIIWPLALMALGLTIFLQSAMVPGRVTGGIVLLIGVLLLLRVIGWIRFSFSDIWPLILIGIGIVIILKSFEPLQHKVGRWFSSMESDPVINIFALFAGFHRQSSSQDFVGGNLTAIMGGIELDLRTAAIPRGEAVLKVFALMGGIEIKVPPEWTVTVEGSAILGGFEDKSRPINPESTQKLIIRGNAILGGISIKTQIPDAPSAA